MKVAILTDIHGNFPALQAVLVDIDSRGDIEHTFCLGDMIGIGRTIQDQIGCKISGNGP